MGESIETLADLIPRPARAICIGINPAPRSVEAGHYYQGRLGQQFFSRLRAAGVLDQPTSGFDDDAAVAAGIGFTDIVKRPTSRADQVSARELRVGAGLLLDRLRNVESPILIFPFKKAAEALVGPFDGNGWIEARFDDRDLFVMPGPYASKATAERTVLSFRARIL
jgi:TDG/mug DNA glycosylase family protein